MDSRSFDRFTRSLAAPKSRRGVLAGLVAIVAGARAAGAQVTQAQCGNKTCRNNPGRCADGCVCCVYANGNARCRPPGTCGSGTEVSPCQGAPNGGSCGANADCCSGICQVGTCVATVAGTCAAGADYCADPSDANKCGDGQCTCLPTESDGTICGITLCEACASDADCAGTFGFAVEFRCVSSIEGGCCDQVASYCAYLCPPQSCFTGETLVAMADGTTKPIAMVERGDLVLGQTGVNRVEAIERPLLGARRLYSLNGGAFFVTSEHPFQTEEGWKAVDPAATAAENPLLIVGRLQVGDRLLALVGATVPALAGGGDGAVEPRFAAVDLGSLIGMPADPATPLYNLRLDGDHTYVANDLVVHNK